MTAIHILCPICKKTLNGTSDLMNWKVQCECCGSFFVVTFDNVINSESLIPILKETEQHGNTSSSEMPKPFENIKIGRFADSVLRYIFKNGICNTETLLLLQQEEYCAKTFHFRYPLIKVFKEDSCNESDSFRKKIHRYWKTPVIKNGQAIFICSQWYSYCKQPFLDWLKSIGLNHSELKNILDHSARIVLTDTAVAIPNKEQPDEYVCQLPLNTSHDEISTQNFSLDTVPEKLAHTKPMSLQIEDVCIPVSSWKDVFINICKMIYEREPQSILLLADEQFSRRTKKNIIKQGNNNFISPALIADDIWLETNFSADSLVFLASEIVEYSNLVKSSIRVVFERKKKQEQSDNTSATITSGDTAFDDILDRWGEDNF